jgi:acetyltransferase
MSIRNLDKIFKPQRVAIVGASNSPDKVGYTVLRNLVGHGFAGVVYPVNAQRESVQGIAAYPDLKALPHAPDLAVICTPAASVPGMIHQCGDAGVGGVVIISAGFREVGPAGRALEEQVRAEAARFPGLRIIGPNCLGIMVPGLRFNASFAADMPPAGSVAFLSQSGALCTAVLDWAKADEVGFSHFVSVGNMLDVGLDDLLDYLAADPNTSAVMLYVESITEARDFMSAARAFSREKPIIAYKAGRFAESSQAAASHTGAMAGVDEVYEAALRRAGIVRVFDIDEMFDCAELLARQRRLPDGGRLAIVTNAGGPGVMATDALLDRRGTLARLAAETLARLDGCLPSCWSHNNPVDVLGDAPAERYAKALEVALGAPEVDAVLVILTPQAMTEPTATAAALIAAAKNSAKPVLASWMGHELVQAGVQQLNEAGIPTYTTPEHAVRAFMNLVAHSRRRELLYETPRDVPVKFTLDRPKLRERFDSIVARGQSILTEDESKELLEAYGIPATRPLPAHTADEATSAAEMLGYPVVLKILSPDITHKTEVGGVVLDLASAADVRGAFDRIVASARRKRPDANVQGVTVQRMVTQAVGVELIVGSKRDPVFGPVIMVGLGGIAAEVFRDHALELPPLNERLARRMLESLRSWPLLQGFRGRPPLAVDRLVETLMRFSYLIADLPEIQEVDINPLLVMPDEVVALDARIVVDRQAPSKAIRPYGHLAICPYPERFTFERTLKSGERVILRPIKPEDEPEWHALLARCSTETIFGRFHYLFKESTHEMAKRFCYVDYDREIALVAEIDRGGAQELIGVGRLVADPDHESADYTVLVADAWQGHGLGSLLTEACLAIADQWGLASVFAESPQDNVRMLRVFRAFGFELEPKRNPDVVLARRVLAPADQRTSADNGTTRTTAVTGGSGFAR